MIKTMNRYALQDVKVDGGLAWDTATSAVNLCTSRPWNITVVEYLHRYTDSKGGQGFKIYSTS